MRMFCSRSVSNGLVSALFLTAALLQADALRAQPLQTTRVAIDVDAVATQIGLHLRESALEVAHGHRRATKIRERRITARNAQHQFCRVRSGSFPSAWTRTIRSAKVGSAGSANGFRDRDVLAIRYLMMTEGDTRYFS